MDLLRRLFNRPYRQARAAEGAGEYRRAAALYVEANAPEEAVNALLVHAARTTSFEERLGAYHDALRWLPPDHLRAGEVEAQLGLAVLSDARQRGARTGEEKRRLEDAAERLERLGRDADAATAFEILGRGEDAARCLEKAGEVERLEAFLDRAGEQEQRERMLRASLRDYEVAMETGDRDEARRVLERALRGATQEQELVELLRRLDERLPAKDRVCIEIDGTTTRFIGKERLTLGRADADVCLRGASLSRLHTEIGFEHGRIRVKDLGSRNGTLVSGVPIASEVDLESSGEIGLGDDVVLRATLDVSTLTIEVVRGLDRGTIVRCGRGHIDVPGARAIVFFDRGRANVAGHEGATLTLGDKKIALPIAVLIGDAIRAPAEGGGEVTLRIGASS